MARADILNVLYSKNRTPLDFKFESLTAPPLLSFITIEDIQKLNNIATSLRYSSKIEKKYKEINNIMTNRGFIKFHSGTNRIVYRPLETNSIIVKIALDKVGLHDTPDEYQNQFLLKPFVTKVFEASPCGTIGSFERVQPITSRQEFASVADDIFELINNHIIGEYVLEDIGTKYFMNFGIRNSFGPVLLDFPYVYKLDGNKLYCNTPLPHEGNRPCGGSIDYDNGFNNLICSKCGKRYLALDLKDNKTNSIKILKEGEDIDMKIQIVRGEQVVRQTEASTDTIITPKAPRTLKNETIVKHSEDESLGVVIVGKKPIQKGGKNKGGTSGAPAKNDQNKGGISGAPAKQDQNRGGVSVAPAKQEEKKEMKPAMKQAIKLGEQDIPASKLNMQYGEILVPFKEEPFIPEEVKAEIKETLEAKEEQATSQQSQDVEEAADIREQLGFAPDADLLSTYGLTEKDFEEGTEENDNIEDKYSYLEEKYGEANSFERIVKNPKELY